MRIEIIFKPEEPLFLTFQYQRVMQALLYELIDEEEFATFLHDEGYVFHEKRKFKLLTFSKIIGPYEVTKGGLLFKEPFKLYISCGVDEVIERMMAKLLFEQTVTLAGVRVRIESVKQLSTVIKGDTFIVSTLSPITVYQTQMMNEKKKTIYYNPYNLEFEQLIKENLYRKLLVLNPNTTLDAFEIEPINLTAKQKKVMKYKSTIIEAWEGTYKITTTKALMRVALECGLGAKNGQGFGMIKLKHSR